VGLRQDIGRGPVGLDTAIFIYFIEEHAQFLPLVEPVFAAIDTGALEGTTSGVTLLEVLVAPYRAGDLSLAARYEALLTRSRNLHLVELDRPLLRAAAHLRATCEVKTPDALQLAAALARNCSAYLTNDRDLPRLPGLRVLQLRDYPPAG
jgi:predicted nucleic acid-binding protein